MGRNREDVKDEGLWRLIEGAAQVRHERDEQWAEVCPAVVTPLDDEDTAWYRHRRENALTRRLCVPTAVATLLAVAVTFLSVPTDGYHLADGWTVEKMVETNNHLLGK